MANMMEDAIYTARQVKILIFRNYQQRMKIRLFTDSEATLETIASSKKNDRKTLRMTLVPLKEQFVDGDIYSYSWLPTKNMWADIYFNYGIRVNSYETMRDTYVTPEYLEINSNELLPGGRNTIHYIER